MLERLTRRGLRGVPSRRGARGIRRDWGLTCRLGAVDLFQWLWFLVGRLGIRRRGAARVDYMDMSSVEYRILVGERPVVLPTKECREREEGCLPVVHS